MDSGDSVTLHPLENFIDYLYGRSTVIMMLEFTLNCKDGESQAQVRYNVVIYLLKC